MSQQDPVLVGMVDPIVLPEGMVAITLAESLMRLAASSLDEAVEGSEKNGGVDYMQKVGASMGILSHLMHGLVLKQDHGERFKERYEAGFKAGLQAAANLEHVFYDS